MRNSTSKIIVAGIFAAALSVQANATQSRSIVVESPSQLPEIAQRDSQAMYLHYTGDGRAILYLEQDQGRTLAIVDVTDPAAIRGVARVSVDAASPYDFVDTLHESAVLVRYRDDSGFAVINLKHFKKPVLTQAQQFQHAAGVETLGQNGLMMVSNTVPSLRAQDPDYKIFDVSNPSNPAALATVDGVQQRLERSETGTTFFLGKDGLTVVRRPRAEEDYAAEVNSQRVN